MLGNRAQRHVSEESTLAKCRRLFTVSLFLYATGATGLRKAFVPKCPKIDQKVQKHSILHLETVLFSQKHDYPSAWYKNYNFFYFFVSEKQFYDNLRKSFLKQNSGMFKKTELPGRTEGLSFSCLSESVDIFLKSVERQGQREQDVRVSR